jgi:hypothetical protein
MQHRHRQTMCFIEGLDLVDQITEKSRII